MPDFSRFHFNAFHLYVRSAGAVLGLIFYLAGWKRGTIRENRLRIGLRAPGLRLRLCVHASTDLLRLIHGRYGQPVRCRAREEIKLKKLKSRAALFLTGHFHNWELMGSWMVDQGVPLLCAARPLANGRAQSLLESMRRRLRLPTVSSGIPRSALRHLDRGGCFALLWDQRVPSSPTRTSFCGVDLLMDPLPDFLMRHRPLPVWFGVLLPGGRFRLVELSPNSSLPVSVDRIARRYHRLLEFLIRRHPTYWYGMAHRRFKDVPEPE